MDGHFVPNLSWGAPVVKCLRPVDEFLLIWILYLLEYCENEQHSKAFFDVHLMVSEPAKWVKVRHYEICWSASFCVF